MERQWGDTVCVKVPAAQSQLSGLFFMFSGSGINEWACELLMLPAREPSCRYYDPSIYPSVYSAPEVGARYHSSGKLYLSCIYLVKLHLFLMVGYNKAVCVLVHAESPSH
jgi:hypothetical protein